LSNLIYTACSVQNYLLLAVAWRSLGGRAAAGGGRHLGVSLLAVTGGILNGSICAETAEAELRPTHDFHQNSWKTEDPCNYGAFSN
jgi:hypothetical protein